MFDQQTYIRRRAQLKKEVGQGLIILFGNNESPANGPFNGYHPFRQDSSFLYYFGQNRDGLVGVIDIDNDTESADGRIGKGVIATQPDQCSGACDRDDDVNRFAFYPNPDRGNGQDHESADGAWRRFRTWQSDPESKEYDSASDPAFRVGIPARG